MSKSPKPEPPTADIIDIIQAICRPSEPQSKWILTKFKTPMSKSTKSAAAPVELSLKDLREIQYSLIKGIVDSDDTTRAGWTAFKLPDNREVQTNMAVLASVNSTVPFAYLVTPKVRIPTYIAVATQSAPITTSHRKG